MPTKNKLELTMEWENQVSFILTAKVILPAPPGPVFTVLKADEDGHLTDMFPALVDGVERYIKTLMERIREDMYQT